MFAGISVLLLATAPVIFLHSTIAYANLPLSYYIVCGVLFLIEGTMPGQGKNTGLSILAGIFFVAGAWTRPEGLIFGVILWVFLLFLISLRKPQGMKGRFLSKTFIIFFGIFAMYTIFWTAVKSYISPHLLSESDMLRPMLDNLLTGNISWDTLRYILQTFLLSIFDLDQWGLLGFSMVVMIILALVRFRHWPEEGVMVFVSGVLFILILLGSYYPLSTFYSTTRDISFWLSVGLERMAMPGMILCWLGLLLLVFSASPPVEVQNQE
jgi:hypothetical protein